MTIYELLEDDHREVSSLFEEIEACLEHGERRRARSLFRDLKSKLTAHAKAEQEVFYRPLKELAREEEGEDLAWEGEEEHHVICLLLSELDRLPIDEEVWPAKIKVLSEIVDHHVEEEENEIFREARKLFSNEETRLMAKSMEDLKELYMEMIDVALAEDVEIFMHPAASAEWSLVRDI